MKKWMLIGGVVTASCCVLSTLAVLIAGATADAKDGAATATAPNATAPSAYRIYGTVDVTAEGFAESLEGTWLFMDGVTLDTVDSVVGDTATYHSTRSGELWVLKLDGDGDYLLREVISVRGATTHITEKGSWAAEAGATLTLTPSSCSSLGSACDGQAHAHRLQTTKMTELVPDNRVPAVWSALRLVGTYPEYWHTYPPRSYLDLQRVE